MAARALAMSFLLAVITVATTAEGAGKAAAPPVDCMSVVVGMTDCLSYVSNGSNVEKPEGNCCSGLKQVLKSNPDCLCQAFKSSAQFGVVLNVTKALALPTACHVHAPSPTNCGLSTLSPAGAPAGAVMPPAGAPSLPVANAPASGFGATATSPAAAPGLKTGASSALSISIELLVVGIAAAFFSCF